MRLYAECSTSIHGVSARTAIEPVHLLPLSRGCMCGQHPACPAGVDRAYVVALELGERPRVMKVCEIRRSRGGLKLFGGGYMWSVKTRLA